MDSSHIQGMCVVSLLCAYANALLSCFSVRTVLDTCCMSILCQASGSSREFLDSHSLQKSSLITFSETAVATEYIFHYILRAETI